MVHGLDPSRIYRRDRRMVVTEIGRQPYIVHGVLRTSDAVSPVVGPNVALSLLAYVIRWMMNIS